MEPKQESMLVYIIGLIFAKSQKSGIGSKDNWGGPITVMVSENVIVLHLLLICKLTTYWPGLFIINIIESTEFVYVPFVKFHEEPGIQPETICCTSQIYVVAKSQSDKELEVFVAVIAKGIQPIVVSKSKEGIGSGTMHTFFVMVSVPQLFSIIIEIKYSPGLVKFTSNTDEPQAFGLLDEILPNSPPLIFHPELGVISH
jgi:hypothetical protein